MNRRILITGGNRGIGAAIAESLRRQEYEVVIVCRDRNSSMDFIRRMDGKGLAGIRFIEGDLGSMKSARAAAARIRAESPDFCAFVHNAGMWPVEKVINEDGLEQSFATNHLGPFLLNRLLEDLFIKNRCRVVQVSAGLYVLGRKDCGRSASGENFSLMKTYATTKLLNLVATMAFAERWRDKGVTINAVHPGVVKTGLGADIGGIRGAILGAFKRLWLSPEKGAAAPVALATDQRYAGVTGAYFERFARRALKPLAADPVFSREVWEQAIALCEIRK
ncbi:MAG: SDR family NAD(P)-dependent oxidoreductase [Spirochaetes bacterium]|nr:MAG: SDR family NAD(P)-dependent oxidoreductase [Spirochaetota bacterium]